MKPKNPGFIPSDRVVSLLGGGQLGRMFIQEALSLGMKVRVLDPDSDCPCSAIADEFVCGSLVDYETVMAFCSPGFPVTVEIENVNVEALKVLKDQGVMVIPDPYLLEMIQDKGLQKEFYRANGFPTADFEVLNNPSLEELPEMVFPFVQKTRKGGYDGKGVQLIKDASEWKKTAFLAPSILERVVPFQKEIGVLVVGDGKSNVKCYPPVEMVFDPDFNLVDFLVCPAVVSYKIAKKAESLALSIAQTINLRGILAVEMFVLPNGDVLVNEMAPRTHNSGHNTIEASVTSQFCQQARLMANLPLGDSSMLFPSAMVNVIGRNQPNDLPNTSFLDKLLSIPGVFVHMYGKRKEKPGRKMGHVTILELPGELIQEKIRLVKEILS